MDFGCDFDGPIVCSTDRHADRLWNGEPGPDCTDRGLLSGSSSASPSVPRRQLLNPPGAIQPEVNTAGVTSTRQAGDWAKRVQNSQLVMIA